MAPFDQAINITKGVHKEGFQVYVGDIDPEWVVGAIPNGGYVLALIVDACIQHQSKAQSGHVDPIHVTAHYLRTTAIARFEVFVRVLKSGRGFTNLTADLVQESQTKITTHLIFGINKPSSGSRTPINITPPSRYARRIPLYTHPSTAVIEPMRHTWGFHSQVNWTKEPEILKRNRVDSVTRTDRNSIGGEGLEWGAWFEFVDKSARITNPSLAFLVDIFLNTPTLLPRSERPGLTTSWFPTMTLAVEFKSPIPALSEKHASRTVGLYSSGRFLNDPQGRHDMYVEVWTAPCNLGEGKEVDGWRDNQICLAVATQMALTIPIEVNQERGRKNTARL
ncbi:thioesterase-like superfamily-domain-containing protein [Collybia nuda]|uniref:Thioesterase-like superfamily-domain-containing protein n=1 Tax=Collybia nuda TaxID=64659 RepID=A0A9P5YAG3_9AGAR|nr:thioesterase-like superfamily-domain-containing protein [Collybia nuda]